MFNFMTLPEIHIVSNSLTLFHIIDKAFNNNNNNNDSRSSSSSNSSIFCIIFSILLLYGVLLRFPPVLQLFLSAGEEVSSVRQQFVFMHEHFR